MTRMPTFEEILGDFERGVRTAGQHIEHPFRHDHPRPGDEPGPTLHAAQAARQAPASRPATMAAAPARPKENTVSIATLENDLRDGVAAVKNEIGRFESNLPAIVAEARAIGGSPLGQLAVTAAQHLAAGILPPEALAIVESGAARLYGDILGLYAPQGAQQGQQPVQASQGAPAGQ